MVEVGDDDVRIVGGEIGGDGDDPRAVASLATTCTCSSTNNAASSTVNRNMMIKES